MVIVLVKQKEYYRRNIVIDQLTVGTSSLVLFIALGIFKIDVCERNLGSAI
jgi:hypothetical protein